MRYLLRIVDACEIFVMVAFMLAAATDVKKLDTATVPLFIVLVITVLLKIWGEELSQKPKRKFSDD